MARHRPSQVDRPQPRDRSIYEGGVHETLSQHIILVYPVRYVSHIPLIKNGWPPPLCEEHNAILRSIGGPLWRVGTPSLQPI